MGFTSEQIISAVSYAGSSVLILIFNKILLSSYKFNFPVTMTTAHQCVCMAGLLLTKKLGFITFADIDRQTCIKALPLSLCFVLNIIIGMGALRLTSIPMFSTLRRLTVLIVIAAEYVILHKKTPSNVVFSVFVMVCGAIVGGWFDLEFDLMGYALVLINDVVTAAYLTLVKRTFNDSKFKNDTFGVLYLNSCVSLPFLFLLCFACGEAFAVPSFPHLYEANFQLSFLGAAMLSFAVNYFIFWCTAANSPLTTSVTGQVKNALCTFGSLFLFGGSASSLFLVGLSIGVFGSILYARALAKNNNAGSGNGNGTVTASANNNNNNNTVNSNTSSASASPKFNNTNNNSTPISIHVSNNSHSHIPLTGISVNMDMDDSMKNRNMTDGNMHSPAHHSHAQNHVHVNSITHDDHGDEGLDMQLLARQRHHYSLTERDPETSNA